jgi:hypothetical protein
VFANSFLAFCGTVLENLQGVRLCWNRGKRFVSGISLGGNVTTINREGFARFIGRWGEKTERVLLLLDCVCFSQVATSIQPPENPKRSGKYC